MPTAVIFNAELTRGDTVRVWSGAFRQSGVENPPDDLHGHTMASQASR